MRLTKFARVLSGSWQSDCLTWWQRQRLPGGALGTGFRAWLWPTSNPSIYPSIHPPIHLIHLSIHVYTCLSTRQASNDAWTYSWKRKWDRDWHHQHGSYGRKKLATQWSDEGQAAIWICPRIHSLYGTPLVSLGVSTRTTSFQLTRGFASRVNISSPELILNTDLLHWVSVPLKKSSV